MWVHSMRTQRFVKYENMGIPVHEHILKYYTIQYTYIVDVHIIYITISLVLRN